jgi:hypothetical protein
MGILHNNFPCIDIFHLLLFVLIVMSDVVWSGPSHWSWAAICGIENEA